MPVDPNIALSVQTPPPVSPLQTIGSLMQMRDTASQIALRNAQTQQAAAQTGDIQAQAQQRQRDLQSWNDLRELLKDPQVQKTLGSGDYTPVYNAGVTPNVADQFIKNHQSMMQTAQVLQKGKADFYASGRQQLAAGLEGLDSKDDTAAAEQYAGLRQTLAAEHPELSQRLPNIAAGPNFRSQISDLAAGNGIAHAILENQAALEAKQAETASKQSEASLNAAKTPGAQAESEKQQIITKAMKDAQANPQKGSEMIDAALPASVDARANAGYKAAWQAAMSVGNVDGAAQIVATAASHGEQIRHNRVEEQQGAQRVAIENAGLGIRRVEADPFGMYGINPNPVGGGAPAQLHGDAFLQTLPAALQGTVKAIAEGRQDPISGFALTKGPGAQIMAAVQQYDPQWSAQRAQIRRAFTTGKAADNIGSLNTATVHLDQLAEAAKAMSNGTFVPGNEIWNKVQTMFGGNAPTNFAALQAAVNGEMANALKGNATDPEIANIAKTTQQAGSPAQLAGAIETHLHTLGAKLNTYQERYQQQIPGDTTWSPVMPSAAAVYQKHGMNPTAGPAANVTGSIPALPSTLSSSDVGKVYLSKSGQKLKITAVNPQNPKQFQSQQVE